jgi:hypothetical protein
MPDVKYVNRNNSVISVNLQIWTSESQLTGPFGQNSDKDKHFIIFKKKKREMNSSWKYKLLSTPPSTVLSSIQYLNM